MTDYNAVYEDKFVSNLRRYSSIRKNIKRRVEKVLTDPYQNTEALTDASGKLNLRDVRSARIDRNFRIIFVICEECRNIPECEYCFCEGCRLFSSGKILLKNLSIINIEKIYKYS